MKKSTKFSKLRGSKQMAVALMTKMVIHHAPEDFHMPDVPAKDWIKAFAALNPIILPGMLPSAEDIFEASEYIRTKLYGHLPGVCPCCSTYVAATPSAN